MCCRKVLKKFIVSKFSHEILFQTFSFSRTLELLTIRCQKLLTSLVTFPNTLAFLPKSESYEQPIRVQHERYPHFVSQSDSIFITSNDALDLKSGVENPSQRMTVSFVNTLNLAFLNTPELSNWSSHELTNSKNFVLWQKNPSHDCLDQRLSFISLCMTKYRYPSYDVSCQLEDWSFKMQQMWSAGYKACGVRSRVTNNTAKVKTERSIERVSRRNW